ncbi:MAG: redoxin domain-containing protein [Rhodomicrobium sp.]|nr:redoxin domain-containing protein [Rhodomicrobium sp.]
MIGDVVPDFEADTTHGRIRFHDWIGDTWCMLFSHPKNFTPVCTTELGFVARLKPEFERRNCKIIGLSVDPVEDHVEWGRDIGEVMGHEPEFPIIGDPNLKIARLFGMVEPKPYLRYIPDPEN